MGLMDYLNIAPPASEADKVTGTPAPPPSASHDKMALPDFDKAKPEMSSTTNDIDFNKLIREKGYYGAFQSLNKKPDFEGEEKRTRRARELTLLGDIANLGGQAVASSMGARRFAPINSQVPQYNERLQRLRDAKRDYDADLNNKSLSMIFRDYEQKRADDTLKSQTIAKQAAVDLKFKQDLTLKQIDQAFQAGMLDAKGRQALGMQAVKAKSDKELEALKNKYRLGEIGAQAESGRDRPIDSMMDVDGKYWTRSSKLTDNEAMQIVQSSGLNGKDLEAFTEGVVKSSLGEVTNAGKINWRAAAAYASGNGMIDATELEGRGFKRGNTSANGTSSGQQGNNKTGLLLPR